MYRGETAGRIEFPLGTGVGRNQCLLSFTVMRQQYTVSKKNKAREFEA